MEQTPTIGRIVHYLTPDGKETQAALITGVNVDGTVALKIFPRSGEAFDRDPVGHWEVPLQGHWSWPPRV